jgi:hypothetical protein
MIAQDYRDPRVNADRVRELFDYCQDTGVFTRRVTVAPNATKGSRLGCQNSAGHLQICIHQRFYMAHRLAWLWMTGEWPADEIDHINQVKSDNRWSNLRLATRSQNLINRGHRRKHDLPRGVSKSGPRYQAQIREDGRFRHLGMFGCPTAAHFAWLAAAKRRDATFLPAKL